MKRILIKPLWECGLQNQMFQTEYPRPFQMWREVAERDGFELCTWDTYPLDQADCVWVMDLPRHRHVIEDVRRKMRPGVPLVLHIVESPLFREKFVRGNWRLFDHVVTYERVQQPKVFSYRLPVTMFPARVGPPFAERRCVIMINRNQTAGYFAARQHGLVGLPGIGKFFSGWHLPKGYLFRPAANCLYGWRREFARRVELIDPALLTIVGPGWNGEQLSWCPLHPHRPYACAKIGTVHRDEKFDLISQYRFGISVENLHGDFGYISEKIFDTLLSGAVPVYWGDRDINDVVPRKAMVHVNDFRNISDLVQYLRDCPENEWTAMRDAGREFLESPNAIEFSDETFVNRMVSILRLLLNE